MRQDSTKKNRLGYAWNYLVRIWFNFIIVAAATLCYAVIGEKDAGLDRIIGTLVLNAFFNILVAGIISCLFYRGMEKKVFKGNADKARRAVNSLPFKSALMTGLIGAQYVAAIAFIGFSANPENYRSILQLADFFLAVIFAYIVLPVYYTLISVDALTIRIKKLLHSTQNIIFQPRGRKIWTELLLSFIVVAVIPVSSLILSMATMGVFTSMDSTAGYTLATVIIIAIGVLFTVIFRTGAFTVPIRHLEEAAENVRAGRFETEAPVISDNELGSLTVSFNRMTEGLREREMIRDVFGRMVAPAVRDHVLSGNISLGGQTAFGTVLFTDIRGFTTLSESMEPEQVVALLNRYFEHMGRCVSDNGGFVNKFIGDALMALYGVPASHEAPADAAVTSAIAMQKELARLNAESATLGLPVLKTGIGIHSGRVLAGNIGSSSRMEYTVIGDTVNVASRIEGLTKLYADGVLISSETRAALKRPEQFTMRFLCRAHVKGREEAVEIYEVMDGLTDQARNNRSRYTADFEKAARLYYAGQKKAACALFTAMKDQVADDLMLSCYLALCAGQEGAPVPGYLAPVAVNIPASESAQ